MNMDYAYGPGERLDAGLQAFADFYGSRANTTLVTTLSGVGLPSLEGLVRHLNDLPNHQKPIDDVFICSHGNESGWLEIRLTSILPFGYVDFDTLLAVPRLHTRFRLDAGTITAPAAGQPGTTIRFRSCRIGHAEPFMQLLKNAFGGQARISAAKHFFYYGVGQMNGQDIVYEYLVYSFLLTRRNVRSELLSTRPKVVGAFRDAGKRYYNDTDIPSDRWKAWVPLGRPKDGSTRQVRFRLAAGEPLSGFKTELLIERIDVPHAIPFSGTQPNQAIARTRARDHLQTLEEYQADYPPGRPAGVAAYPAYARNGFSTLTEYVDAHQWTLGEVSGHSALIGSRMEYTLKVPIFDPATNLILHNLVPTNQTGPSEPPPGIDEMNAALFWNQ
jgi:hypothetical protein